MNGGSSDFSSSLTDMMTSLMVIFILLLVNYLKEETDKAGQIIDKTKEIKAELEESLQVKFPDIKVKQDEKDPFTLVIVVPKERLRFKLNDYSLHAEDVLFLDAFIPSFLPILCSEGFEPYLSSVVVEGHADQSGSDELNLKLSQNRAFEVMQYTVQHAEEDQGCFLALSSASGRGESEPVMIDGKPDDALSRRVEFKVRVKSARAVELRNQVLSENDSVVARGEH